MRPANWLHDRNSFFKYTTRQTARIVLESRRLRWSSPKIFNDPFDIQFDLHVDLDIDRLKRRCLDEDWRILHSPDYDYKPVGLLGYLTSKLRDSIDKISLSRQGFDEEFGPAVEEGLSAVLRRLPETQAAQRKILEPVKLLCLSESHDNILMWSHYSELHRGAVLELRCVPEVDSAWGAAQSVKYSERMPRLFDEDLAIKMATGEGELDVKEIMEAVLFTKAIDWAYEKEWRVVGGRSSASQVSEDLLFDVKELAGVYLGCQMPDEDVAAISVLAASHYPAAKIYRAHKSEKDFKLEFIELTLS